MNGRLKPLLKHLHNISCFDVKLKPQPRVFKSSSTVSVTMALLEQLQSQGDWIKVKNATEVENKLQTLVKGGDQKLQFVVDFDYTLTRAHKNGGKVDCSWGVIENSPLLPVEYTTTTNKLKAKYLLIEQDPKMEIKDKIPYMIEWYGKANKLLQECNVNKSMFQQMVKASNVELRDDTGFMMNTLEKFDIPVLILSAGLGDLVEEICKSEKIMSNNVKIVSNFLDFDADGRVTGIKGNMIHMFNKNESAIHDSPYFKRLEHRSNIILIGDSLGDLHMADGVKDAECVLKIGFLNNKVDERLPK